MTTEPILSVKNVFLRFGKENVLNNISVDFFEEEIVSIIGINGAGKTSLLKLIAGIYQPSSWTIIKNTHLISYVPQKLDFDTTLPVTAKDFLTLYNPGISHKKIKDTLTELKILNLENKMLWSLSWWQIQRILLAQALLNDPRIILLDEPTASIDLMWEELFFEVLDTLYKKRKLTIILVSHDIHTVFAKSTRVICLNQHVCCVWKPNDVSKHANFKEIFGSYLAPYHHSHDHCKHHEH